MKGAKEHVPQCCRFNYIDVRLNNSPDFFAIIVTF